MKYAVVNSSPPKQPVSAGSFTREVAIDPLNWSRTDSKLLSRAIWAVLGIA